MIALSEQMGYRPDMPEGQDDERAMGCVFLASDTLNNYIFERCREVFPLINQDPALGNSPSNLTVSQIPPNFFPKSQIYRIERSLAPLPLFPRKHLPASHRWCLARLRNPLLHVYLRLLRGPMVQADFHPISERRLPRRPHHFLRPGPRRGQSPSQES